MSTVCAFACFRNNGQWLLEAVDGHASRLHALRDGEPDLWELREGKKKGRLWMWYLGLNARAAE